MENLSIEQLQCDIINLYLNNVDKKLKEFFEPYLRNAGIKGEITANKIKWRGIKMKINQDLKSTKYQLNQRGIDISPVLIIKNTFTFK